MNQLKPLLETLHRGGTIILKEIENQCGELLSVDFIYFEDGVWMRSQLNCWSSQDMGMGTCRCISHPTFKHERITRKEVLSHLRQLLRNEAEDRAARGAEIAWLEEQLKAL